MDVRIHIDNTEQTQFFQLSSFFIKILSEIFEFCQSPHSKQLLSFGPSCVIFQIAFVQYSQSRLLKKIVFWRIIVNTEGLIFLLDMHCGRQKLLHLSSF